MQVKFSKHFQTIFQIDNAKILVACSGGVDSVVLAHLLSKEKNNIAIAHCNFKLRGEESDEDEAFVKSLAEKYKVPFYSKSFNTKEFATNNAISTQMAARELRYHWFFEILQKHNYNFVATAHHTDDALETFLINLTRGSGIRGLMGIPEQTETIIRPLLPFTREEILQYAKSEKLFWREDSSNTSTAYLRNKLRLEVISTLKKITPSLLQNFAKTQSHLQDTQLLVEDYMSLVYNLVITETDDGYRINIPKIVELPNTNALLYELLHPFGFTAWDDVYALIDAQSGKKVLAPSYQLLKDRNTLLLTKVEQNDTSDSFFIKKNEKEIQKPVHLRFIPTDKIGNIINTTVYVDADLLSYPLQLRKWQEGDVFQPFGMKGKKKLSKFFKDEKLSLVAKEKIWLLCSQEKIVWVIGYRLDDRFKVTSKTKNLLKITLHQ